MYELRGYQHNNSGKLMAEYSQKFYTLELANQKSYDIKDFGFINFEIYKDSQLLYTNFKKGN